MPESHKRNQAEEDDEWGDDSTTIAVRFLFLFLRLKSLNGIEYF
jgi:hypothetical protein